MIKNLNVRDLTQMAKRMVIPISVLVEVCYKCNQNCCHCCLSNRSLQGLSLDQYKDLFDQLSDAGTFFVILTGGEPFVRNDFLDIVRHARKKRFSTTIFTNGTLITKDIIAELKSLFVQEIHISIYGSNSENHDSVTLVPGSFVKSMNAVKELLSCGISVKLKCPLMKKNVFDLDRIKSMANDLGIDVQFTNIITSKDNGDFSTHRLRISREDLRKVLIDSYAFPSSTYPIHFIDDQNCIPCDTVFNGGSIDPLGNVYPCNQWQIKGGNILEKPFAEIWKNSLEFVAIRSMKLRDMSKCGACNLFEFCSRCPGLAFLEDGDLKGCSSTAKTIAEIRRELGIYPIQTNIFSEI